MSRDISLISYRSERCINIEIGNRAEFLSGEKNIHTFGAILAELHEKMKSASRVKCPYHPFCPPEEEMKRPMFSSTKWMMKNCRGQAV